VRPGWLADAGFGLWVVFIMGSEAASEERQLADHRNAQGTPSTHARTGHGRTRTRVGNTFVYNTAGDVEIWRDAVSTFHHPFANAKQTRPSDKYLPYPPLPADRTTKHFYKNLERGPNDFLPLS